MADLRDLIAETLAAHVDVLNRDRSMSCSCGDWLMLTGDAADIIERQAAEHRLHRADMLQDALDGRLLPEGGEATEEWRVAGYSARNGNFVAVLALPDTAEEAVAEASCGWTALGYDARPEVRTATAWPDGSQSYGPWRPVATGQTPGGTGDE